MSKITIPLLMIFAAVGFAIMAKLDHGNNAEKKERWPEKIAPAQRNPPPPPVEPLQLEAQLSNADFERLTNRELINIRLLPLNDNAHPISFLWPTGEDDTPAHPELLEFAERVTFEGWKSHIDDEFGFYYPDFPGVRVESVGTTDPIPVLAPAMLPPENNVAKKYRITAGDTGSLCVISIAHTTEFDDAERAPFPEVFHRYVQSGGGLLRTSFTADGLVRRAELLGQGIRISLLDWPHLAVHQDIYLRIAAGLRLPRPHGKWIEFKNTAIQRYGLEGKLGFLNHGITEGEIISNLGQPVARDPERGTLQYFRSSRDKNIFYTLPMRGGLFAGFDENWRKISRTIPVEGSLRWMCEKTDYCAGPAGGIGYDLGALTNADVQNIFDRIVELAPSAGADDWATISQTVYNLSQHGLRDQRLIDIARVKLESKAFDPVHGLLALEACGSDLAKAAIAEHITREFASAKISTETLDHYYTLIAFLGKPHPASVQLIDRALRHESGRVRELGFKYCSWLPEKFALPHLEAGLHDPSTEVRRRCASAFANSHGDPERHAEMLNICLTQETDEEVKLLLQEALQRFAAKAGT